MLPRYFSGWRGVGLFAWTVVVALLTLTRQEAPRLPGEELPGFCLLCGARGTADALLNILLFVPLGIALGGAGRAVVRATVAGFAASALIETLQMFVVGRHSTVSDVLWNTVGAGIGVLVYRAVRRRLESRWRMDVSWGAALAAGFILAGGLMAPAPTEDDYWGQWTPRLGSMPQYGGEVLEARINGREMPSRRLDHPGSDAPLLRSPWAVQALFVVGPPPEEVSPIVSIYDGHQREILLLGAHRNDLVFRQRMLAHRLRFDVPDVRIPEAFGPLDPRDTIRLGGRRADGVLCLRLGPTEECGLGSTPGRSWGLLLYPEGLSEFSRSMTDVGWLALLFAPIGFFGASAGREALALGVALAGMIAAVGMTPLVSGTWLEVSACVGGVLLGHLGLAASRIMLRVDQGTAGSTISDSV